MKSFSTHSVIFAAVAIFTFVPSALSAQGGRPADSVNPFIGASTNVDAAGAYHGLGKTFPGAATPFGMVQVSPNTITGGDNGSGYSYEHTTIEGFAMTQMSGVGWYGDLGNFLVMPTTGAGMKTIAGTADGSLPGYRSHYDKKTETARAGYYSCLLTDYGVRAECTATPHCGLLRFTYPENNVSRIQIDLARRVGGTSTEQSVRVVDSHTIEGYMVCTPEGGGWGNGDGKARYTVWFHARFSKPLEHYGFWTADIPADWSRKRDDVVSRPYLERVAAARIVRDTVAMSGRHIGFFTEFATKEGEQVDVKVGLSFVDMEGARRNFDAEVARLSFDKARRRAADSWNKALSRISVEGGTADDRTVFYTALYHTMIDPRTYADCDGRYIGGDYKVHTADPRFTKRTIFSGWDVFRSQFPLQTLINPRVVSDMINSLTTLARESGRGYYERWEMLNSYSGCMLGNPAIPVMADAWAKGIRTWNAEEAFGYALSTTKKFGNGTLGYTPGGQCLSYTLEYAYADWCLGRMAEMLGKSDEAAKAYAAAQAYRSIFDPDKGWFRPREADGSWQPWPEEGRLKEWYGCVECNPLQQGWFVPHDPDGMVELMGGRDKVIADLNDMFERTPDNMMWNLYYNHANEPVHFVPYLFNRIGAPWLTQKWTRHICRKAYSNKVEGLCGNEDVGQMSAWYVLSAIGLHQYCPGDTRVEITSPVFDKVTVRLDSDYYSGRRFVIKAVDNSPENIYIQRAELNGKPLDACHIDFSDITSGGELVLYMGPQPNKNFGTADSTAR